MSKSKHGFTLIESLVVLTIVSLLFSTGNMAFKRVIEQQHEKEFWATFDREWKRYEQFANLEGVVTYISFDKAGNKVSFRPLKTFDKENYEVQLPKTLSLFSNQEIKIGSDGYVKPQTIAFNSKINKCTYRMTVQLGWGVYHIKRE
ncbi:competence type IV pilus minor pilin ComGD [Pediococcus damnosus]|uniref:competence type IV pilus minor pilin ComGD n=1 Tax=Pediococcus damnosus TaxID=51663 RepID=UPI00079FE169|nr:competence type IV pilus minor pilin ComGD [Pediococcus damnosus]